MNALGWFGDPHGNPKMRWLITGPGEKVDGEDYYLLTSHNGNEMFEMRRVYYDTEKNSWIGGGLCIPISWRIH